MATKAPLGCAAAKGPGFIPGAFGGLAPERSLFHERRSRSGALWASVPRIHSVLAAGWIAAGFLH